MFQEKRRSGRSIAAKGMAWSSMTVILAKLMSVISQIILGYLLSVETYAVFAAATAALAFVSGFQNSGVGKVLIQRQDEFDDIAADFAGCAFYIGVVGAIVLVILGATLSASYNMPTLLPVLIISAVTVPIISVNALYTARQSIELKFRSISYYSILSNLIYYGFLISSAYLGAESFSVSLATLLSAIFVLIVYVRRLGTFHIAFRLSFSRFVKILGSLKWTILSSYVFGFTQSGDYLILGIFLDKQQLGQYYFGFMLAANVGILLSLSISQTLMPIFSKIKDDNDRLKRAFLRASEIVNFFSSIICIGFVALVPEVVRFLWQGKWDASIFVAVAMGATFPMRVLASMAAVVLEAQGRWVQRTVLLLYDAVGIMAFAAIGVMWDSITGAAVAVAAHRGITGLVSFPIAMKEIDFAFGDIGEYLLRTIFPFVPVVAAVIGLRFWLAPISNELMGFAVAAGTAAVGASLFVFLTSLLNPGVFSNLRALARGKE
ncbi:oligosaccharide flippase family protein [Rhizobium terrae]|uniref:oligosaccharide flippase family protein n=1 Tax=Rhizobium terrae TaxID=2171756 RepID=UPI000E3C9EE0|nr:oligosaccharide flippase family protein [Rhizobium terrae]